MVYGTATALAGSASGGSAPYTYAWTVVSLPNDSSATLSDATSAASNVTLTGPNGTFTLRLTVTDANGTAVTDDVALTLNATTLAEILGSNVLLNYDATALSNGAVSSWASTGSDTTALAQGTGANQPVRAATSFNSAYPGVTFDGVNDELLATLSGSGIPSGSRPYAFVVAQLKAKPGSGVAYNIAKINTATTGSNLIEVEAINDGSNEIWRFSRSTIAGADAGHASGASDLLPHVFGMGFTTDPLAWAIDGAMLASSRTAATDADMTKVRLGNAGGASPANVVVAQFVVCGTMPSATQIDAVNAFMRTKWGLTDTLLSTTRVFDVSQADASFTAGAGSNLSAAECVGTNMYLTPWVSGLNKWAKWDMTKPFREAASWTSKDLTSVGLGAVGATSGCNDGRYIYITPENHNWIRFDTTLPFASDSSYASFDLRTLNGGATPPGTSGGAVFDGRYVYVIPLFTDDLRGYRFVRYDTQPGSFTSAGSYTTFDATNVDSHCCGYLGGAYDGARYVYFSPYANNGASQGYFLRYDTQGSFTSANSWQTFNLATINAALVGFNGVVCAAGKVFLVPAEPTYNAGDGHVGAMYDPSGSFTSAGSYTTYDFANIRAGLSGWMLARYDGSRYIYYPCEHTTATNCTVLRYDTQGSYTSAASYVILDSRYIGNGTSGGFIGMGVGSSGNVKVICPTYHRYAVKIIGQAA